MGITATAIYEDGVLRLLTPLSLPEKARVRVRIEPATEPVTEQAEHVLQRLLALATDLGGDEREWLQAAARNPAFAFLAEPAEDIYTLTDGEPFHDQA